MKPKLDIINEANFTMKTRTNQKHGQQNWEAILQDTQTFENEAFAAHESLPMKIQ
jgi:hypothetical protein